jgi:hypothetical protein
VNETEADHVRSIFSVCASCSSKTEALAMIRARGWAAKGWTSARSKQHGGQLLGMSTLSALLTNVLYRGDISHKGVVYPGEHQAIVLRELWLEVNHKLKLSRTTRPQNARVETLLGGLVKCGQCGAALKASFTRRRGEEHIYCVCRAGKNRQPACPQRPVACCDLDGSLPKRLDRAGARLDHASEVKHVLSTVSYHSGTRCVSVELRDGSQFDYFLPVPVRPEVTRRETEAKNKTRMPRISRLLALAHRFEEFLANGTVQTYRELAELGHVSRPRLTQIIRLAQLAPDIQEQLLFLPPSVRGADLVFETTAAIDRRCDGLGSTVWPIDILSSKLAKMDAEARKRYKWIELYDRIISFSIVALKCGISRVTLRKWVRRYERDGIAGLVSESRQPNRSPARKVSTGEPGASALGEYRVN